MYPPSQAKTCQDLLNQLLPSLMRAGLEIEENIGLVEKDKEHTVKARLKSPIPEDGWEPLKQYMGWYSLLSGWRVSNIRRTAKYLTFTAEEG